METTSKVFASITWFLRSICADNKETTILFLKTLVEKTFLSARYWSFLNRFVVLRQYFNPQNVKEDYYSFTLVAHNGSILYRTTIEMPWEVPQFTRFKKLEITSAYATSTAVIVLNVKNTGSADATITDIFINGKPLEDVNGGTVSGGVLPSLSSGDSTSITLTFTEGGFTSGVTVDVKVHTASGT
ncbi:MAG: hypothetical protein ACUVQ8_06895, partial [Nitrososphaeria archaeon]